MVGSAAGSAAGLASRRLHIGASAGARGAADPQCRGHRPAIGDHFLKRCRAESASWQRQIISYRSAKERTHEMRREAKLNGNRRAHEVFKNEGVSPDAEERSRHLSLG